MKYEINFCHPAGGERTVSVQLSQDEQEICQVQDNPELHRQAYALSRAYREAPKGFLHVQGGIRAVSIN